MKLSYLKNRDLKDKPSFIDEAFLKEITNEDTSLEPHPKDILLRNIEAGFVKARDITKKDTHEYSSKIKGY